MSFDKAEYQREYMARRRAESNKDAPNLSNTTPEMSNTQPEMLDKNAESNTFDWRFGKRYEQWVAARGKYGKLTAENWPPLALGTHPDWPWDEDHIYQLCEHGRRYCVQCGTATAPPVSNSERWVHAYDEMRSAAAAKAEETKRLNSGSATR